MYMYIATLVILTINYFFIFIGTNGDEYGDENDSD